MFRLKIKNPSWGDYGTKKKDYFDSIFMLILGLFLCFIMVGTFFIKKSLTNSMIPLLMFASFWLFFAIFTWPTVPSKIKIYSNRIIFNKKSRCRLVNLKVTLLLDNINLVEYHEINKEHAGVMVKDRHIRFLTSNGRSYIFNLIGSDDNDIENITNALKEIGLDV